MIRVPAAVGKNIKNAAAKIKKCFTILKLGHTMNGRIEKTLMGRVICRR